MIQLAARARRLKPSPIREILSVISQPGMISFAGGLPSAASFPTLNTISIPSEQLQYGASEGDPALRELIAKELNRRGLPTTAQRVLVLSGSQQGIDLVAKLLVEEGSRVALESPSYLAALQVFSLFGASYLTFAPDQLAVLNAAHPASLVYTVPTFQNPSGHCYSAQQRGALAAAVDRSGGVLFEDDPYRDLAYEPCDRQPVCSLLQRSEWVYQSSFSKTLAPGLRLGYLTASESLFPLLVQAKQAADLHSNRVCQQLVLDLLDNSQAAERLALLVSDYRNRRDHFNQLLEYTFADLADWQRPVGGLFFWLKLKADDAFDTRPLLAPAVSQGVAFMPGEPFFTDPGRGSGRLRLNFSNASAEQVEIGLVKLAAIVRRALQR